MQNEMQMYIVSAANPSSLLELISVFLSCIHLMVMLMQILIVAGGALPIRVPRGTCFCKIKLGRTPCFSRHRAYEDQHGAH